MLLGDIQHHVRIEQGEEHEARAHRHREREAQREAVGVEHRQHRVDDTAVAALDGGTQARACAALASRLRWVRAAPLGVPVVPLVYWMMREIVGLGAGMGCRRAAAMRAGSPTVIVPVTFSCSAWRDSRAFLIDA